MCQLRTHYNMIWRDPLTVPLFCRTNIEQGPVLGKTITTDTRTGNLIVAILAVVSTIGK